jgi:predicted N-acyltransferase
MIEVFDASQRDEWQAVLKEIGADDIYFSPDYVRLNGHVSGGTAECFVYRDGEAVIAYPYLRRPIDGHDLFDLTSPYGFGGYVTASPRAKMADFTAAFRAYCRETRVVSEFIRYHPLFENHEYAADDSLDIAEHQLVVVAELDQAPTDLAASMAKDTRKKIRKAEKAGISIVHDAAWEHYQAFTALYHQTMDQKSASRFYHFSSRFFAGLVDRLADRCALLLATLDGRMIGGLLIFRGPAYGYNYLSCSDYDYTNLGTNDALQLAALEWARDRGVRRYLLGGGLKGEDSLFRFKAKFSPDRGRFFIGRRIHLPDVYQDLCVERMKALESDAETFFEQTWFPLYRIEGM